MQVRMKIGPKAGQIVDLVYHAARTLVEAGQAEDVHEQMRLPSAKITRIEDFAVAATEHAAPVAGDDAISADFSDRRPFKKKRK